MRLFDWRTNHILVNNVELTHFGEGSDVLTVKRAADLGSHKMSVDGKMTLSLSADKSGTITVKLAATSPSNSFLSKLAAQQDNIDTFTPVTFQWHDSYRKDDAKGSTGYIKRPVDIVRGKEIGEQEWTFVIENLQSLLGDPTFAGLPTQPAEAL
jgi:hypothetical protein